MCDGRSKVTHVAVKRGYIKQRTRILHDIYIFTDSRVGKKQKSTLSRPFFVKYNPYIYTNIYAAIYY